MNANSPRKFEFRVLRTSAAEVKKRDLPPLRRGNEAARYPKNNNIRFLPLQIQSKPPN